MSKEIKIILTFTKKKMALFLQFYFYGNEIKNNFFQGKQFKTFSNIFERRNQDKNLKNLKYSTANIPELVRVPS